MTQLGGSIPPVLSEIRSVVRDLLAEQSYQLVDAASIVTGRDFLLKIWEIIISVPVGIAILHEEMKDTTIANVFYELGLMQAYGKETLVIKTQDASIPSDFVRTEYLQYGADFPSQFRRFLAELDGRAGYLTLMADQLEKNPLLAIDCLRRAYLLTGDADLKDQAQEVFKTARLVGRAKNSVEKLLINF
jgi:hypothetical protein